MLKKILIALGVIIVAIQFIPVDRSNPPVIQEIDAPANVLSILKTSCYDCHSNETNWPWYSYVAPVSFLVAGDVEDGRKRVNFSEWDKYDEKKKEKKMDAMIEEVEEGGMPLPKYLITHSEAKMDPEKIKLLKDWVTSNNDQNNGLRYQKEKKKD
ncbi:MAG: heme-binding domain-containing protein [Ignavibacteriaceae bacterium]|nr:heme-binding domain-containing protein [Ignavibacteriaceae bacterium]